MDDQNTLNTIMILQKQIEQLEESLETIDNILYASDMTRIQGIIQSIRVQLSILETRYRTQ